MKKTLIIAASMVALITAGGPAVAKSAAKHGLLDHHNEYDSDYGYRDRHHDRYDRVDRRQDNQARRIARGVKSGELTRHEAKRLRKEQRRIARLERRLRNDGYLSKRERRTLDRAQDAASDHIREFKHNHRTRSARYDWNNNYSYSDRHHDNDFWGHRDHHAYRTFDDFFSVWSW